MAESLGLKSVFQRQTGTDGTTGEPIYSVVARVASVQPPQPSRNVGEVDDLNPADDIKQKLPGVIDAGEVTLTLNFDAADTGHTALETDFYAGTTNNYRVKLPDGNGWTFPAFISGWAPQEITEGDVIQAQVTFTVTGKPTFGPITP